MPVLTWPAKASYSEIAADMFLVIADVADIVVVLNYDTGETAILSISPIPRHKQPRRIGHGNFQK